MRIVRYQKQNEAANTDGYWKMDDGHCTVADKREAQDAPSVNPPAGFGWAPDLATTARAILDNTPPAPSSSTQTPTTAGTSATLTATTYGPPTT